jgi:DNA-binding Xre family transcriptional regulator
MIDDFEKTYPDLAEKSTGCHPGGRNEMIFILSNGDEIAYDSIFKTIRTVYNPKTQYDEYDESEDACKEEFCVRLNRLMALNGFNNIRLSDKTGISTNMISQYVTGQAIPKLHIIRKIAWALGCSVGELIDF